MLSEILGLAEMVTEKTKYLVESAVNFAVSWAMPRFLAVNFFALTIR
jgi:hypothetical protein